MFKLDSEAYGIALEAYRSHTAYFPLIAAVLLDLQNGMVFADNTDEPGQFYVEHAFGFSQIFGVSNPHFEEALEQYLLQDKSFFATKVRLYTPYVPEFLTSSEYDKIRSERQRFTLDLTCSIPIDIKQSELLGSLDLIGVDRNTMATINNRFAVIDRFWRTSADFLAFSQAVVAWFEGKPIAICYAAAVADGYAEIDVITSPEYRNFGIGGKVVNRFIQNCTKHGLRPVWDCFTNNAGSMALCKASGFVPSGAAYPFYTIQK